MLAQCVCDDRVDRHALARARHAEYPPVRALELVGVDQDGVVRHAVDAEHERALGIVGDVLRAERNHRGRLRRRERPEVLRQVSGGQRKRAREGGLLLQGKLYDVYRPGALLVHEDAVVAVELVGRRREHGDQPLEPRDRLVVLLDELEQLSALRLPVLQGGRQDGDVASRLGGALLVVEDLRLHHVDVLADARGDLARRLRHVEKRYVHRDGKRADRADGAVRQARAEVADEVGLHAAARQHEVAPEHPLRFRVDRPRGGHEVARMAALGAPQPLVVEAHGLLGPAQKRVHHLHLLHSPQLPGLDVQALEAGRQALSRRSELGIRRFVVDGVDADRHEVAAGELGPSLLLPLLDDVVVRARLLAVRARLGQEAVHLRRFCGQVHEVDLEARALLEGGVQILVLVEDRVFHVLALVLVGDVAELEGDAELPCGRLGYARFEQVPEAHEVVGALRALLARHALDLALDAALALRQALALLGRPRQAHAARGAERRALRQRVPAVPAQGRLGALTCRTRTRVSFPSSDTHGSPLLSSPRSPRRPTPARCRAR